MGLPFSIGTEVMYAGGRWRVERVLGAEAVLLRSDTGEEVSADPLRITFLGAPELRGTVARVADETRYDDAGWAAATRRRDLIVGLASRPRTAADVTAVGEALGVTPRRVWALLRQVRVHGDSIAHFLPTRHVRRAKRLDRRVEAIIQQSIDQHYAKLARPSLNSLIGEVERRCRAAGVVPPCGKSIKARVRAQDHLWLTRRREGWGKARALRLLTGGDRGACAPWERVQIDSTPCDIRLVREQDRTVIGRPNITLAIDLYSRTVLGFSVSLHGASTVTVATCVAHACLPKQDWLMRRDLSKVHWPVWGKPTILEYDQGPEHEAKGIQRGLRLHGIRSKIRAKGHPEHHGTIERLIGTMMRRVHERRGTTFSNVNERGDIEPAELACLTLPELERIIVLEIDSYNHAVHAGIGDRPLDRYLAYYQRPDLSDGQRIPPIPPAERFLLDFLPFERRRLVRTGLRLFRVDYSSHDLLPMWRRQNHAPVERIVVYDPRSLATIWVVDEVTGEYVAVPCRVPRADMTLAESEAARQRLQALKAADRTEARLPENPAATTSTIPAVLIQAPNGPRIAHLLTAIRAALGQPLGRRETIAQQRAETYRIMQIVGLRLLLIDDLHDIRGGAALASMLVQLREVGSVLGVSLGCFATREIAYVLRQDDQLTNRFELMTLPRWQIEDPDYWRLLHTFGRRLPLRDASDLTDPKLAAAILTRSNGLIGAITRLLRHAAVEAVRTGHERIDHAMLDRVRTESPAMIETLATSDRF